MFRKLFSIVKNLKVKFSMSNSDVPLVAKTFEGYEISKIDARRAINSKNPGSTTTVNIHMRVTSTSRLNLHLPLYILRIIKYLLLVKKN